MGRTARRNIDVTVFLCHAKEDIKAVRKLQRKLGKDKFRVWVDEKSLLPGQDWEQEIQAAIKESDVVLVCLSENSITKRGYVQKEIRFAMDCATEFPEDSIFVVPVRLTACEIPKRLNKWQCVDLYRRGGYSKLKDTLLSCHVVTSFASSSLPGIIQTVRELRKATAGLSRRSDYDRSMSCCKLSRQLFMDLLGASSSSVDFISPDIAKEIIGALENCQQKLQDAKNVPYAKMMQHSIRMRLEFMKRMLNDGPSGVTKMMEEVAKEL